MYKRQDLRLLPVHSITSIHSDPYREYGADTLISADDYDFDSLKGQVRLKAKTASGVFERGDRAIKAIFSAGYTNSTCPPDIIHAICVWASQLQRNKTSQGKDSISQRGGSVNITIKTMPTEVKEYLNPHRLNGSIL